MRRELIRTLAVLAVCGLGLSCGEKREGFEGAWKMEGYNYSATLTVSRAGEGFRLVWEYADGTKTYGIGLERDSVLVAVQASDPPKIMAYKRLGGHLSGMWVEPGGRGLNFERTKNAARLRRSTYDLTGTYALEGTAPDGSAYTGELSLELVNLIHIPHWDIEGGENCFGAGFTLDSLAILGYGIPSGYAVGAYLISEEVLDGMVVSSDAAGMSQTTQVRTGSEKALRR